MIKLSNGGAYLINGTEVIEEGNEELLKSKLGDKYLSKEEAGKNTIAYGILKEHNTSGSMDKLQIKLDKLTTALTEIGTPTRTKISSVRASGEKTLSFIENNVEENFLPSKIL